jgi:hypothetical protein
MPTPPRKFRIDDAEWTPTTEQAARDNVSVAEVVRAALADYRETRNRGGWPSWLPSPTPASEAVQDVTFATGAVTVAGIPAEDRYTDPELGR